MIDAYYNAQWHLALDPLYENFQRWKAGEVAHDEMEEAIHSPHRKIKSYPRTCNIQPSVQAIRI
jgi:hypothetical protein